MGLLKALETALEIMAQADPTGPRELIRCATGYRRINIHGDEGMSSRAVRILKKHSIEVGGVTQESSHKQIITVPAGDRERALEILNEEL